MCLSIAVDKKWPGFGNGVEPVGDVVKVWGCWRQGWNGSSLTEFRIKRVSFPAQHCIWYKTNKTIHHSIPLVSHFIWHLHYTTIYITISNQAKGDTGCRFLCKKSKLLNKNCLPWGEDECAESNAKFKFRILFSMSDLTSNNWSSIVRTASSRSSSSFWWDVLNSISFCSSALIWNISAHHKGRSLLQSLNWVFMNVQKG